MWISVTSHAAGGGHARQVALHGALPVSDERSVTTSNSPRSHSRDGKAVLSAVRDCRDPRASGQSRCGECSTKSVATIDRSARSRPCWGPRAECDRPSRCLWSWLNHLCCCSAAVAGQTEVGRPPCEFPGDWSVVQHGIVRSVSTRYAVCQTSDSPPRRTLSSGPAREGPSTPYALERHGWATLGNFWSFPHTLLYTEPPRLAALGHVTETRETEGRRRRIFSITAAGESAGSDGRMACSASSAPADPPITMASSISFAS